MASYYVLLAYCLEKLEIISQAISLMVSISASWLGDMHKLFIRRFVLDQAFQPNLQMHFEYCVFTLIIITLAIEHFALCIEYNVQKSRSSRALYCGGKKNRSIDW